MKKGNGCPVPKGDNIQSPKDQYRPFYTGSSADCSYCRRFHFFDQLRVWCARNHEPDAADAVAENAITLSEPFWQEIQAHPIPVDLAAARALAHNPGCLDFYMWLTWRCFTAKRAEAIPLFGSAGLAGQLGVPEYSRERNFRKRVRGLAGRCAATLARLPGEIVAGWGRSHHRARNSHLQGEVQHRRDDIGPFSRVSLLEQHQFIH